MQNPVLKPVLLAGILIFLSGMASADVLPPPGDYNVVNYDQTIVFDGNYADTVFLFGGLLPSMCNVIKVADTTIPQRFPNMYKFCDTRLYGLNKADFEHLLENNDFTENSANNEITPVDPNNEDFLTYLKNAEIPFAVSDFVFLRSSNYPDRPEYRILSRQNIKVTETVTGINWSTGKIISTHNEEITNSTPGPEPNPAPNPQPNPTPNPEPNPTPNPEQIPAQKGIFEIIICFFKQLFGQSC